MSTRGAIAKGTLEDWKGRYHHWDSHPFSLGETLFRIYNGHFAKNLKAMLKVLIVDHVAWSTIVGKDFSLAPGYSGCKWDKTNAKQIEPTEEESNRPQCYCHGGRHEEGWFLTQKDASEAGVEYAYVFEEVDGEHIMHVLSSYCEDEQKMIGAFGMGDPKAHWKEIAAVDLDGEEPNWQDMHDSQ